MTKLTDLNGAREALCPEHKLDIPYILREVHLEVDVEAMANIDFNESVYVEMYGGFDKAPEGVQRMFRESAQNRANKIIQWARLVRK